MIFKEILENFKKKADKSLALWQKNYMRRQFEFLGVNASDRNLIIKKYYPKILNLSYSDLERFVGLCWDNKYREMQYAAMWLLRNYSKKKPLENIGIAEFMIENKSWWDTVDFIAPNIAEPYFFENPQEEKIIVNKWLKSDNLWLRRSSIIYQLKRKEKTDTLILLYNIKQLADERDFFIQKAIGWALREYSKVNPDFVIKTCEDINLSNLAHREALKYLKRKGFTSEN